MNKEKQIKILLDLESHIIPEEYGNTIKQFNPMASIEDLLESIKNNNEERPFINFRDEVVARQGFALVSKKWIKPLANYIKNDKCVELMAGLGTITYSLKEEGIDIIATDKGGWNEYNSRFQSWTSVEILEATEAIKNIDAKFYIMSWAPYNTQDGYNALMAMRKYRPDATMIYIGEGMGGCTADDNFYNALYDDDDLGEIEDDIFDSTVASNFENWEYIHDYIILIK